jgi:hypothetical protein
MQPSRTLCGSKGKPVRNFDHPVFFRRSCHSGKMPICGRPSAGLGGVHTGLRFSCPVPAAAPAGPRELSYHWHVAAPSPAGR